MSRTWDKLSVKFSTEPLGQCIRVGCRHPADVVGYPCGHLYCYKCALPSASQPLRTCAHCQQEFRFYAGYPNMAFYQKLERIGTNVAHKRNVSAESEGEEKDGTDKEELQKMQQQFENLKTELDCQICYDNICDTAFECGHRACESCAKRLTNCHYCRKTIRQRIRIYR